MCGCDDMSVCGCDDISVCGCDDKRHPLGVSPRDTLLSRMTRDSLVTNDISDVIPPVGCQSRASPLLGSKTRLYVRDMTHSYV